MDELKELRRIIDARERGGLADISLRVALVQAEQLTRIAEVLEQNIQSPGGLVEGPHGYDDLVKPRDGSHDVGALRSY